MPLDLRNLLTNETIEFPNEGLTIGREGGNADVKLKDPSVSARHARLFADGPVWYVEDLGSAHGTFLGEERLSSATVVEPRDVITISQTKFEVVRVWEVAAQKTLLMHSPSFQTSPSAAPATETSSPLSTQGNESDQHQSEDPASEDLPKTLMMPAAPMPPEAFRPVSQTVAKTAPAVAPVSRTALAPAPGAPVRRTAPARGAPATVPDAPAAAPVEQDLAAAPPDAPEKAEAQSVPAAASGQQLGLKYFLVAVPKAVAFYLAAIPLMIVNPVGAIRKGVRDQKHEAKGRMELIAYALPVNLFSAAVGFLSTLIVQLVTSTLSIGGLVVGLLLIPAVVAVVTSVITGFVWHPVMGWIITKLKGESDERSRTNYFLMFMTATALVALPGGVGTVLGLVPLRLIAMVQPILSALGSVVLIFVAYSWMTQFNVMKWFRTVLLVLGGLAVVGGVFGVLGRLASSPGGAGGSASDVEAQGDAARKRADRATREAAEATEEANLVANDAEARAKAAVAKAEKGESTAPVAADGPKPSTKAAAAEKPASGDAAGNYPAYLQLRDSIEKAIAADPTLLNRVPGVLALYHDYTSAAFEVDSKFDQLNAKKPADAKLNVRLREAELFEKTEKTVKELFRKLNLEPAQPRPRP